MDNRPPDQGGRVGKPHPPGYKFTIEDFQHETHRNFYVVHSKPVRQQRPPEPFLGAFEEFTNRHITAAQATKALGGTHVDMPVLDQNINPVEPASPEPEAAEDPEGLEAWYRDHAKAPYEPTRFWGQDEKDMLASVAKESPFNPDYKAIAKAMNDWASQGEMPQRRKYTPLMCKSMWDRLTTKK